MSGKHYRWRSIDKNPPLVSKRVTCNVCRKEVMVGRPHLECIEKGIQQFNAEQRAAFAQLRQEAK